MAFPCPDQLPPWLDGDHFDDSAHHLTRPACYLARELALQIFSFFFPSPSSSHLSLSLSLSLSRPAPLANSPVTPALPLLVDDVATMSKKEEKFSRALHAIHPHTTPASSLFQHVYRISALPRCRLHHAAPALHGARLVIYALPWENRGAPAHDARLLENS